VEEGSYLGCLFANDRSLAFPAAGRRSHRKSEAATSPS